MDPCAYDLLGSLPPEIRVPIRSYPQSPNWNDSPVYVCSKCGCRFAEEELIILEWNEKKSKCPNLSHDYDVFKAVLTYMDFSIMPIDWQRDLYMNFISAYNSYFYHEPVGDEDDEFDDEDEVNMSSLTLSDCLTLDFWVTLYHCIVGYFFPRRPSKAEKRLFKTAVMKLCSLVGDKKIIQTALIHEIIMFDESRKFLKELIATGLLFPMSKRLRK